MKRKNNWNLFGVIALIVISAFMLISCPQNLATERPKLYKTLTLDIGGQKQNLYYGEDGAWYSALSDDGLLLDENKVTGEDVKFNIPSAPTWTVTFNKNTPEGTSYSEFEISSRSVEVHPELSLSDDSYVNKTTGKVLVSSISEDKTVTGTYPPTAIVESVTASSTNVNYEFAGWTVNGEDVADIATYEVNRDTEIVANWSNISSFKKLTVKDRDVVTDTVYYNATDKMWYDSNDITSGQKTSVDLPQVKKIVYIVTLNYNNGDLNNVSNNLSSFLGYGEDGDTSAIIGTNGSLYNVQPDGTLSVYTIDKDTELVSLWSEVKFNEPSQPPTKDGYVFNGWYKDGKPYDFNSVVTEAMTLTAHWTQKTFKTLTLDIGGQKQNLYYGEDGAWYSALSDKGLLLNENKVTGDAVKFTIPKYVRTVYFNKNTQAGASADEITISNEYVEVQPELSLSHDNVIDKATGKVLASSISETITVTGTYPPKAIGQSVTASSTNPNYSFAGWTVNGVTITDIVTYEVNGPVIIDAKWNCLADFKSLTIRKNENSTESSCTVYFNKTDKKWYASKDLNIDNIITSIQRPADIYDERNITIYFYANNSKGERLTMRYPLQFEGYGEIYYPVNTRRGMREKQINANGQLGDLTIDSDTVYYAFYGGKTFNSLPTYTNEGKTFDGWYIAGNAWFKKDPATERKVKNTDRIPDLDSIVSCNARWS